MRTETEAWNEDTKNLQYVEQMIKESKITDDNYFTLFSKVSDVEDRTSLCIHPNYIVRIKYCKLLQEKLSNLKLKPSKAQSHN